MKACRIFGPLVLATTFGFVGMGCEGDGSRTGLQADAGRQDEAMVASEKVQRMDRGIPEGAASNPQNDAGFARPPASEGSYGPNPVP